MKITSVGKDVCLCLSHKAHGPQKRCSCVSLFLPTPFKKFLRCLFTEKVKMTVSFQLQNLTNELSKQLHHHHSVVLALLHASAPSHRRCSVTVTDVMVTMLTHPIQMTNILGRSPHCLFTACLPRPHTEDSVHRKE